MAAGERLNQQASSCCGSGGRGSRAPPDSVIPVAFESSRAGMNEALTDLRVLQSLEKYMCDSESGTAILDDTREYNLDEWVRDDASEFFSPFARTFCKAGSDNDAWTLDVPGFASNFRATVTSAMYECDGKIMRSPGGAMLSGQNWKTTCQVC